jgi:hypothetical protein
MKLRKIIVSLFLFFLFSDAAFAQTALQQAASKADQASGTVNDANSTIDNTTGAVNNAASTVNKVGSIFKKKAKPKDSSAVAKVPVAAASQNTNTLVGITNISWDKLAQLENEIKTCAGVSATEKKFDQNGSAIKVTFKGTTDALVSLMLQSCKDVFSSSNIVSEGPGFINLKL